MNAIGLRTGLLSLGRCKVIHDPLYLGIPASLSPVKANQSSGHSSTALFLTRVVQNQQQKIRKSKSSE